MRLRDVELELGDRAADLEENAKSVEAQAEALEREVNQKMAEADQLGEGSGNGAGFSGSSGYRAGL